MLNEMAYLDIEFSDVFIAVNTECKFKNCKNTIIEGRSDKVYCSKSCKNKDQVYKKRDLYKKNPVGRPVGYRKRKKYRPKKPILKKKMGRPIGEVPFGEYIEIKNELSNEMINFILKI
jgi:hypothetical protein